MDKFTGNINWNVPDDWQGVETIDMHTGGEPLRVITGGLPEIKGNTILEKRRFFREKLDYLRTGLMWEPRGHADMYGAVITPPVTDEADFGTFFLHNEGYSTMCGHAIIALTKLVLEAGMIKKEGPSPQLVIDAPPGKIYARAQLERDRVKKVAFRNVPSFVYLMDQQVDVEGIGRLRFDIAYGGAFYAFCRAEDLNVKLDGTQYNKLIDYGKKIKAAVMKHFPVNHPFEPELGFLYGTIITGWANNPTHHSRNICIFAEGEVDRSPTGSGVSARAAIHHARGELQAGEEITIESILDTTMGVTVKDTTTYGAYDAVIPEVTGSAAFTGRHRFFFDPEDPLKEGFIFR